MSKTKDNAYNNKEYMHGVDLNQNTSTKTDFEKAKNSGDCDFVMLKAGSSWCIYKGWTSSDAYYNYNTTLNTTGCPYKCKNFEKLYKSAKDADVKVGIFWFPYGRPGSLVADYTRDANLLLDILKDHSLDYPIFLDLEDTYGTDGSKLYELSDCDKGELISAMKTFLDTIRNKGYRVGIYANRSDLTTYVNGNFNTDQNDTTDHTSIWCACWANTLPDAYEQYTEIWQYTNIGTVEGIYERNGYCDMNISFKTYADSSTPDDDSSSSNQSQDSSGSSSSSSSSSPSSSIKIEINRPKLKLYFTENGLVSLHDKATLSINELGYDESAWDGTLNKKTS